MIRFIYMLCLFFLSAVLGISQDPPAMDVSVTLKDFEGNEIYLAYYLGNSQYIRDTAVMEDGAFHFRSDTLLDPGVYLVVVPPENHFFQLLLPGDDQRMKCFASAKDLNATIDIKGSEENRLFIRYMRFLLEKRAERDSLASLTESSDSSRSDPWIESSLQALNDEVAQSQEELLTLHPRSVTALLVRANLETELPAFEGTKEERDRKRFYFYRKHYFDHIDFQHPAVVRTPFLFPRIDEFVNNLTVQHPDSIAKAIDTVLSKFDPSSEGFKYYLIHFLNNYATSKIVGMDAVYVHIVENYYRKGLAPWTGEEQLTKIIKNAMTLKPILIGKKAPDLLMQRRDGSELRLYDVDSEYTVMFFWDPECSHCKKSIPQVIEFYDQFKDRGVSIFAVCTSLRDEVNGCWEAIDERNMTPFINVVDPWLKSRFKQIYDIRSTPQIYILDREKKIIMKRIGAEQLSEVMERLMEQNNEKKS